MVAVAVAGSGAGFFAGSGGDGVCALTSLDVSTVGGSAAGRAVAADLGEGFCTCAGFAGLMGALGAFATGGTGAGPPACGCETFGAGLGLGIEPDGFAAGGVFATLGFCICPDGRGIDALGVFTGR
jgi:hypothetical protein